MFWRNGTSKDRRCLLVFGEFSWWVNPNSVDHFLSMQSFPQGGWEGGGGTVVESGLGLEVSDNPCGHSSVSSTRAAFFWVVTQRSAQRKKKRKFLCKRGALCDQPRSQGRWERGCCVTSQRDQSRRPVSQAYMSRNSKLWRHDWSSQQYTQLKVVQ